MKILKAENEFEKTTSEFEVDEIEFLMRTRHERLAMFLGCGHMDDGTVFLVFEFAQGGSLERWPFDMQCAIMTMP